MSNMVVNTNVLALNSHRSMKVVGAQQFQASARLSSGLKINSAADDAAGLAISEKMRSQIRGLDMASKNAQDASSLIQTAEGGMQEIDNMLQRIRELVVQVSNDTNEHNVVGTGDRQKIQDEIDQLVEEIDSMAERVEFNKKKVINGDYADANEMYKYATNNVTSFTIAGAKYTAEGSYAGSCLTSANASLGAATTAYNSALTAYASAEAAGSMTVSISEDFDSATKVFNSLNNDIAEYTTASTLASTNYITASTALSAATSKQSAWGSIATAQNATGRPAGLYMQIGANSRQGMQISIGSVKSDILGIGDGHGKATKLDVLKISGYDTTELLDTMDMALSYVTSERSKLGAAQNRLDYTMKSLDISSENLSASESRIRDADMAKEMMKLTRTNVLQQAATSMLAQANQAPQMVLQLLR